MLKPTLVKLLTFLVIWGALPSARAAAAPLTLRAAQVCWLEAEASAGDCAAILHVLRRRAGKDHSELALTQTLWAYAALKADTPRAKQARALPDGDVPTWSPRRNAEWRKLREIAAGVFDGTIRNPCPRAGHWGALDLKGDMQNAVAMIAAGKWGLARCRIATANAFYIILRRRDAGQVDPAEQLLQLRALAARRASIVGRRAGARATVSAKLVVASRRDPIRALRAAAEAR